jgi:hypothetical protein
MSSHDRVRRAPQHSNRREENTLDAMRAKDRLEIGAVESGLPDV